MNFDGLDLRRVEEIGLNALQTQLQLFYDGWLLRAYAGEVEFVVAIVVLFVIGAWAAQVTGRHLGVPDHGAIVVDEIAAFLLVLFFVGPDWNRVAFAFLIFRLFDIVKPPPIRQFDAAMKNGVGVMLDDLLAAGYTLVVLALWQRIVG